jgi:hypothetical protein
MKNAALIPSWSHEINNEWFGINCDNREHQPRYLIKKYFEDNGVSMNTIDLVDIKECDGFILFNIGLGDIKVLWQLMRHRKLHKTIYYPIEPSVTTPIHEYKRIKKIAKIFGKVLTWNDDLVDDVKFFKLPIGIITQEITFGKPFLQKKLVTMISGANDSNDPNELYSKRIDAIRYFENEYPTQFEFYGKRWQKGEFKSYRGELDNKHDAYKNFKFAICYENAQKMNGWITEKIFDCFYSGVLPIYWGPDNIEEYIPKDCFIDKRDYDSYDELAKVLENMSETEYNRRLEMVKLFLNSDAYQKFTPIYFAKGFYGHMVDMKRVKFSYIVAAINLILLMKWLNYFPKGYIKNTIKSAIKRVFVKLKL